MQLVEQGKLDLDAGIDRYVDFPVNAGEHLTLRNLMTHTSGYEETVRNIIVTDPTRYADLREFSSSRISRIACSRRAPFPVGYS